MTLISHEWLDSLVCPRCGGKGTVEVKATTWVCLYEEAMSIADPTYSGNEECRCYHCGAGGFFLDEAVQVGKQ